MGSRMVLVPRILPWGANRFFIYEKNPLEHRFLLKPRNSDIYPYPRVLSYFGGGPQQACQSKSQGSFRGGSDLRSPGGAEDGDPVAPPVAEDFRNRHRGSWTVY